MHKKVVIMLFCFIHLYSCSEFSSETVGKDYISKLQSELFHAQSEKAAWVNSPETIAQHFFPKRHEDSNVDMYDYHKRVYSETSCLLIITTKASLDDEVYAERYFISFRMKEGLWKIENVKKEIKRRI
jgi:hypothetical protein